MTTETAERVWVEDRQFRVLTPDEVRKCSRSRCTTPAVAIFDRGLLKVRPRIIGCCPAHLFGRRIEDGRALWPVDPESPAAKRGYVGGAS